MKKSAIAFLFTAGIVLLFSGCSHTPYKALENPGTSESEKVVTFNVVGKGLEPENAVSRGEARILAERAAVADGYRRLAEKLSRVYVDAYMKASHGTVDYDRVRTETHSWLRGTEIIKITEGEYGIMNARMQLRVNFTKKGMVWWPVGISRS